MAAAVYNVNLKRGVKQLSAQDCALKFEPPSEQPVTALTSEQKAHHARERFDAFKAMMREGKRPVQ